MNKNVAMAAALLGIAAYATPILAQDIGVSVSVGQPGFYGRIDIGDAPRPRIIYAEPRLIERVTVVQQPIYLHVRPGHARYWSRYCHEYEACGQRVYFVNDNWYNTVYVQHYQSRGNGHQGDHDGDRHHDDDRHGHNDGRNDNGHPGKGHGKKKGHD